MPLPLLSILPLAGAAFNAISQGAASRKERKWQESQMQLQRDWAIEDYNKMNEYNSPKAQMERLKEAGLNPNLVYGTGAVGNAAGQPRPVSTGSWKAQAPQFDAASALGAIYNTELQKAQIELVKSNTLVRQKDADLKDAELIGKLVKNSSLSLGYKRDSELYQTSIDFAKERLKNMQTNTLKQFQDASLTAGKSYMQSQQNRLMDKTLNDQIEVWRNRVKQGEISLRVAAENILRSMAERSKIPYQIEVLKKTADDLAAGISLKQIEEKLKQFEYDTMGALGKNFFGSILNRLLK